MSPRSILDLKTVYPYILQNAVREDALLRELREETARLPEHNMQSAPEQGQLLALLVKLIAARRIIEVGTFTGYSTLSMARALPEEGYLLACDTSEAWTDIARRYWDRAGVTQRIELIVAPASRTLQGMLENDQQGSFDLTYIDADKENYDTYYELCLALTRPNGLIIFDNTLWSGQVADTMFQDADTVAIRALNKKLLRDERVDISLIPMADGMTLVRKR